MIIKTRIDRSIELPKEVVTDDFLKKLACFGCDFYEKCPKIWDDGVNGDGKCEYALEKATEFVKKID